MRCPVCLESELTPHIRDGIEVDHCGRCRGLWLDRGELDKLLDLAEARSPEPRIASAEDRGRRPEPFAHDRHAHHDDDDDERGRDPVRGSRKRKRKGAFAELLEEVFEVFD